MLKGVAAHADSVRLVSLLDSNVSRCALSKGRSSAKGLGQVCCRIAALEVGFGLYPAYPYCPTRLMPADGPSRGASPPPAAPGLDPGWTSGTRLLDLQRIPRLKRWASNWVRLLLRLASPSSPVLLQEHTKTHTHTHTFLYASIRTYIFEYIQLYTHIHAHIYLSIYIYICIYMYIYVYICLIFLRTYICSYTCVYSSIETNMYTQHTYTYSCMCILCVWAYIYIYTYTYTYVYTFIHAHILTHNILCIYLFIYLYTCLHVVVYAESASVQRAFVWARGGSFSYAYMHF